MPETDVLLLGVLCASFGSNEDLPEGLYTLGHCESRVFVADNYRDYAGHDAIAETGRGRGFNVVQVKRSAGFGETVNQLANRAIGEGCTHLLIQDPAVRMGPAELETMLRFSVNHPNAILSPTIWTGQHRVWFEGGDFDIEAGAVQNRVWRGESDWLPAAFLLVPTKVWRTLGGVLSGPIRRMERHGSELSMAQPRGTAGSPSGSGSLGN